MLLGRSFAIFIAIFSMCSATVAVADGLLRDETTLNFSRTVDSNFDNRTDAIVVGNSSHYALWIDLDHDGAWDLMETERNGTRVVAKLPHADRFLRIDIERRTLDGLLKTQLRFDHRRKSYVISKAVLRSYKTYEFSKDNCSPSDPNLSTDELGASIVDETKKAAIASSGSIDKSCKGPLYDDVLKGVAIAWADLQKRGESYDAVTCMANHGWPQEALRLQVFQERLANPNAKAKTALQCHPDLQHAADFDEETNAIRFSGKKANSGDGTRSAEVKHEGAHAVGIESEADVKKILNCCGSQENRKKCTPKTAAQGISKSEATLKKFFSSYAEAEGLIDLLLEAQISLKSDDFMSLKQDLFNLQLQGEKQLREKNCTESKKYKHESCDTLLVSLRKQLHDTAFSYCSKTALTSEQCTSLREYADSSVSNNLKSCSDSANVTKHCPTNVYLSEVRTNQWRVDKTLGDKLGREIAQEQRSGAAKVGADSVAVVGPPVNLKSPAEAKEAIRRSDFASADLVAAADGVVQMVRDAPPAPEDVRPSQASGDGRSAGGSARLSSRASGQGRQPATSGARVSARGMAGGSGSRHRSSAPMAMPETVAFSPSGNELPGSLGRSGSSGQSKAGSLIGAVGSTSSGRDSEPSTAAPRLFGAPVALSMRMMGPSSASAATSEGSGASSSRGGVASGGSGSLMNAGGSGSSAPMPVAAGGSNGADEAKISSQKAMSDVRHSFARVRTYLDAQDSAKKQQFMDILDKQRIQLSHPSLKEPIGSSNAQWLYVYPNDTERPRRKRISP